MAEASRFALVTGGGSGIGRAAALALANAGWRVVICGRRPEVLEDTVGAAEPSRLVGIPADVADEDQVAELFRAIGDRFGRLDLVFNNAGTGAAPRLIDELEIADWKRVVDVNLTGMFLVARAAFGMMRRQSPQGGRIINNGSISAHAPRPRSAPYTATKHAVTGLTKSIALDGRPFDIACGQIDIGNAATPMTERMARGLTVPQASGEMATEPVMDVRAVADALVYMASLPLDANVLFMTVMAAKMPFVGRG
ncbi:MAG TPA: SDR family oxidoreductase [Caulobacteraceae bacterium]|nr:SDR family oxidoreductase [Caulobacteraceae bacterium]